MQKKLLVHVFYKSKKYNIEESNYQKKKKKKKGSRTQQRCLQCLKILGYFMHYFPFLQRRDNTINNNQTVA